MTMQAEDIYRASIEFQVDNQRCYNVFHLRVVQAAGTQLAVGQRLDGAVAKIRNLVSQAYKPIQHTSVIYGMCSIVGIYGPILYSRVFNATVDEGDVSGDLAPGFTGAVMTISTGLAGRHRRGRLHVGGLVEAYTDGGRLSAAGGSAMTTFKGAFANEFPTNATQWRLGVWSRTLEKGRGPTKHKPAIEPQPENAWADHDGLGHSEILGTVYSRRIGIGA